MAGGLALPASLRMLTFTSILCVQESLTDGLPALLPVSNPDAQKRGMVRNIARSLRHGSSGLDRPKAYFTKSKRAGDEFHLTPQRGPIQAPTDPTASPDCWDASTKSFNPG